MNASPVWITPAEAAAALARLHEKTRRYSDYSKSLKASEKTIVNRLCFGKMVARADYVTEGLPGTGEEYEIESGLVSDCFWSSWDNSSPFQRSEDWAIGDFHYYGMKGYGVAFGVRFDLNELNLNAIAVPDTQVIESANVLAMELHSEISRLKGERAALLDTIKQNAAELQKSPTRLNAVGRRRAEWWPDFVAELVIYVQEVGIPDGIGHQGQSQVFNDVSERLEEREKLLPDRSQTQETINAVLRRLRSAGNSKP